MISSEYNLACAQIANELIKSPKNLKSIRAHFAKIHNLDCTPSMSDILTALPPEHRHLLPILKSKPVRTASGVAVVAVMCKPHRCPHIFNGNICVYCPGGPDSDFEYSTQSYTGFEPTSMRAIRHRYDPAEQANNRLRQLASLGHSIDKVEYIIMGGTFMSLSEKYKSEFIIKLHDALSGSYSSSLDEAIKRSEKSKMKCVGLTIETRPDFCRPRHIDQMLEYGCTRVEMGVQSIYEDVARDTNRGHTVVDVINTMENLKDSGYKVVSHMMPNLPNVPLKRDLAQFRYFFECPKFRPDGLKIYPTLVIRNTGLYELWKAKKFRCYSPEQLIDFTARILALVPPWVRVYRVQRDIPLPLASAGVGTGNLREIAMTRMKDYNLKCRDVRTREVGREYNKVKNIEKIRRDYVGNRGWETFISFEDVENDTLVGMLRLRKCSSKTYRKELITEIKEPNEDSIMINCIEKSDLNLEKHKSIDFIHNDAVINKNTSIIRELHVYGSSVPVHHNDSSKYQHQGFGTLLIQEAERIATEEHKSTKMAIISGIGTRDYYRKFGYILEGPYMVKYLLA